MAMYPRWKSIILASIIVIGIIFISPNFFSRDKLSTWPNWIPNQQINLGLDLEGGSHLLLEIEVEQLILERLETLVSDIRTSFRGSTPRISYTNLSRKNDVVSVRIRNNKDLSKATSLLNELTEKKSQVSNFLNSSNKEFNIEINKTNGTFLITLTPEAIKTRIKSAVDQSIEIIRRRIDETGTREPSIQRHGNNRVLVQLPGIDDPDRIKRLLGRTARLTFQLVDNTVKPEGRMPAGLAVFKSDERSNSFISEYVLQKKVLLSGENLLDAQPTFDQQTAAPAVSFRLDASGGKTFGKITKKNIGKQFAIVLDGKVISAPVIRSAILGGSGIITGGFSVEEANDLAVLLRAGALPAPLTVLEERTVGPGLGADSVFAGKIASIIAFVLVMVFMFIAYGLFGIFANFALLLNIVFIGAALSLLQATLTLPGIAGVVLTIGMAVDANVLIFERIREEIRTGKTPIASLEAGYSKALTTIIDANVTTLIAAILLFILGSGPVKGFSVTLAIGIASSMFTSITLTRFIIMYWIRKFKPSKLEV